ncbi:MAG TPA: DHA2 family efflux MFS transporter permease subunit [Candidatus Dormibacteraeota bacterium]|jgi:EmrB/QacA subfamily drug resistance transporter|nr:DHA2 family efflux MFS transporter permease subunit [Candidatus Dormibacteraeota bacterium]
MTAHPSAAGRSSRPWALALTSVAFFMAALDTLVVITALPAIHRQLGADLPALEWTVNAYSLTAAAGIVTAAALGDRLGRRRLFIAGLLLFTVASAACALAPGAEVLIAARAVQGVGAAVIAPLSLTLLTAAFPPERRGAVVGVWGGLAGLAVASGPLIGGAITQGLDWHWIFWVNVPIGAAAALLSRLRLSESRGPQTRLDLPAVGLVTGGALAVVWGLVRASDVGWGSPRTVAALGLGMLLMAGFLLWERRAPAPLLPPRLFRNRAFAAASAAAFLMNAGLLAAAFLTSQYLQVVLGYRPLSAGLHFLPMTATPILVAPLAGMLSDRVGQRPVMVVGLTLLSAGLAWLALVAAPSVAYGHLVAPLIVAGVGVSMALATAATAALGAVALGDLGKASGTANTLQRFGGVFGIAAATAVFDANGHLGTAAAFNAGFRPALALAAGLAALGALAALGVIGPRRPEAVGREPAAA